MIGLDVQGGQDRLSADGSTIIGATFRWTSGTGFTQLPSSFLPVAASGDGSILLGNVFIRSFPKIALWTQANGVQTGWFKSPTDTEGLDMSADGTVVLGIEGRENARYFIWSAADGATYWDIVTARGSPHPQISDDGKVVVGSDFFPFTFGSAWRWTKQGRVVPLGPMPDGKRTLAATGVSGDGSIIVGDSEIDPTAQVTIRTSECCGFGLNRKPFIWDEVHGARYLFEVLRSDYGLSEALAGWRDVAFNVRISADGRTITGLGVNPDGKGEAWVAYLGPTVAPLLGDYNGSGTVDAADYVVWRNTSVQAGTSLAADGNDDGVVNQADFDVWRINFGQSAIGGAAAHVAESLRDLGMAVSEKLPYVDRVPEPATYVTFALALGLLASRSRSRKTSGDSSVNPRTLTSSATVCVYLEIST
jgi:hypothetical protein